MLVADDLDGCMEGLIVDNETHQNGESSRYCNLLHKFNADLYCFKCRKAICEICRSSNHKFCDVRKLVNDGVSTLCEYMRDDTVMKVRQFKTEVNRLYAEVEPKLQSLIHNKDETLHRITDYYNDVRNKIDQELRRQENELTSKIETLLGERQRLVSGILTWCRGMDDELNCRNTSLKELNISKDGVSESQIGYLQTMQETGDNIESFKIRLSGMVMGEEVFKHVRFSIDRAAEELLLNSQLGTVPEITDSRRPTVPPFVQDTQSERSFDPDLPSYEEAAAMYPPQVMPRTTSHSRISYSPEEPMQRTQSCATSTYTYDRNCPVPPPTTIDPRLNIFPSRLKTSFVGNSGYTARICISAVIWIDDRLLAVDRWNRKLRLFHESSTLLASVDVLEAEPWDIVYAVYESRLDKHFCYVTLPNAKKVQCITICASGNNYMSFHHCFRSPKGYICLAYDKAARLVCGCASPFGSPCVDIIDFKGKLLQTIVSDEWGASLFSYPRSIEVNGDGNMFVCDWNRKEVIILRSDGSVAAKYTGVGDCRLKSPVGTALDGRGNVLISDTKRHAIYSVSTHGVLVGMVISERLHEPRVISGAPYHDGQFSLAVVDKRDKVNIFSIEWPDVREDVYVSEEFEEYL